MRRNPHPWYWRAALCVLAAAVAALLVSGSLLWFSYETYNPWFHPGGEQERWTDRVLPNALGNIGEHSIYAALWLFLGPFWFYGKSAKRRTLAFWSTLYALIIGFLISRLIFGGLELSVTDLRHDESRIAYVAFWQAIYVPNYLYIVAAYALPLASVWCLAGLDAALSKWSTRRSIVPATGAE